MYSKQVEKSRARRSLYKQFIGLKITVAVKGYKWINGVLKQVSEYEIIVETDDGTILIPKTNIIYVTVG
ncbi:MAG: hypothetical protein J7K23_01970 [Thermoproteales archaeon]|nr:hypothetical protein [Thermoproteales archaeon]